MKTKFSTVDIIVAVGELQQYVGMRLGNVYDVEHKTYLFRLQKPDEKATILVESGARIHSTDFEWPKNQMPSGFCMKLRKHIRQKRLESIRQLGIDRIIDLQFGSGEVACHVLAELYDRGNIVLTDHEYVILNVLRPRTDKDKDVRFVVREPYPLDIARKFEDPTPEAALPKTANGESLSPSECGNTDSESLTTASFDDKIRAIVGDAKPGDTLKKLLNPIVPFGAAVLEHCLLGKGLSGNKPVAKELEEDGKFEALMNCLREAYGIFRDLLADAGKMPKSTEGYIVLSQSKKTSLNPSANSEPEYVETYTEFHPRLWNQLQQDSVQHRKLASFNAAVDEFFSKLETQKLDLKALQQEKTAIKKLDNIRTDHDKRVSALQASQMGEAHKGSLIEMNQELVDRAIFVIRSALANQIAWDKIQDLVDEAKKQGDEVASLIKTLKLESNHITLLLQDPYQNESSSDEEDQENDADSKKQRSKGYNKGTLIDIDLGLGAHANARRYFDHKKLAAMKEQKTIHASKKALKSAEAKTAETLKQVQVKTSINKYRKTYWFEKFFWFISSENYLVIGGRDQQQNEIIVKRYLRPGDVYVHADIRGASSVIVKNSVAPSAVAGGATVPIPPKTLNEAGTMAICYSAAWEAKVVTSAWWVHPEQVSKTAPTGEYLSTGSFMIRGRKNFLAPSQLVMGFGMVFKLEEDSVGRHVGERKVLGAEGVDDEKYSLRDSVEAEEEDNEIELQGEDDSDEDKGIEDGDAVGDEGTSVGNIYSEELDDAMMAPGDRAGECDKMGPLNEELAESSVKDLTAGKNSGSDSDGDQREPGEGENKSGTELQDDDDNNVAEDEFPDVEVKLTHLIVSDKESEKKCKNGSKIRTASHKLSENGSIDEEDDHNLGAKEKGGGALPKRGQKHRKKKIKGKYANQDDEERELRLQLLGSTGAPKESKKEARKAAARAALGLDKGKGMTNKQPKPRGGSRRAVPNWHIPGRDDVDQIIDAGGALPGIENQINPGGIGVDSGTNPGTLPESVQGSAFKLEKADHSEAPDNAVIDDDDEDEKEGASGDSELAQLLTSLTGNPHSEDVLLFSVPMCAPYAVMSDYKFKVKLTPGSGKKGKATKTALQVFLKDRSITQRESDLLKSVQDQDLARNIPGKVKVSAAQLQAAKKSKR